MPKPDSAVIGHLSACKGKLAMTGRGNSPKHELARPRVMAYRNLSAKDACFAIVKELANIGLGKVLHGGHYTT
jgi:hypothetical protein